MKHLFAAAFCFSVFAGHAQFKADNVRYKTVFPEDLCQTLKANPGYVLLDVRSDGEYNDTLSMSPSLNIGHLQNAQHIDIRQLPARWKELTAYKDQPLFIYCSHSQRSRRASRLLADSGFTKVYNINGGLTNFYAQGIQSLPCSNYTIVTNVPYKIVSAKQLASNKENYYIIDLRSDSVFNGKTANERIKMEGRFVNAVNIPFENFGKALSLYPDKKILLVDDYGDKSPLAAKMLLDKGFKNVSILFNGMDAWLDYATNATEKPSVKWTSFSKVTLLSPDEFSKWTDGNKSFTLIDVRPKDQFNNGSKSYWQNIGQIKNAVNVPVSEFPAPASLPDKSTPVVVYGFNSENEIFGTAQWFKSQGYRNVYVLQGGIWNLRWASHNLKNKSRLNNLVVNVPAENE
ncbi:rhodanese-like domain-containing protein [Flavisolibacter ginsenosidimutans]|uniref:Rhodanese-like domain-containing protein n=1 Tax=Flavisolibacter ginsenosidimutans TaxID=661481 RepID=A0A5B8UGZ1_9BACT|nr:rhodanese-like domain-containing protein [Flavisolibacter ginsenosidimutans]QEC55596.1 rhodanese-like domain-containing protein [Flavisolibacter ginsenosidimutans]